VTRVETGVGSGLALESSGIEDQNWNQESRRVSTVSSTGYASTSPAGQRWLAGNWATKKPNPVTAAEVTLFNTCSSAALQLRSQIEAMESWFLGK